MEDLNLIVCMLKICGPFAKMAVCIKDLTGDGDVMATVFCQCANVLIV